MPLAPIFDAMITHKASDAFIRPGSPLRARVNSEVKTIGDTTFTNDQLLAIVANLLSKEKRGLQLSR